MTIKFGMPTLIEKKSIIENVKLCSELGLDFVEINLNLPYCMPENISPEELIHIKNNYDVDFTIHFPEDIDFGCFYEDIRNANINLFKRIANWGAKFGVSVINLHLNPGVYFTLPNKKVYVYEENSEIFMDKFLDSMDKLSNISSQLGIVLCVENMNVHDFVEETFKKLINFPNVYFTWDVGHDAMNGYRMEKIYKEHPEKVKHMHLHDYDGNSDHLVLFDGSIPINERLKFANDNGVNVVIETKTVTALKESVNRINIIP